MALSSMICIPLWVFIKVWKTEGTLPEVRQLKKASRGDPEGQKEVREG
jgi:hypothetical protein